MDQVQPLYAIIISVLVSIVGGLVIILVRVFLSSSKKVADKLDKVEERMNVQHDEILELQIQHDVCQGSISGKLDSLEQNQSKLRSTQYDINERITKHEIRISKIEI